MALATSQAWQDETRPDDLLAALDALRIAITIFSADGRLVHANRHLNFLFPTLPPVERLTGERYEELLRRQLAGGAIAMAARPAGDEVFLATCLKQLQPGAFAPRDLLLSDGRILELKARRDKVGRTVILWSDVTQSRHHLGRLEEAIGLSADAVAFYDRGERFVMGNERYAQLAGAPLEELKGKTITEVVTHAGRCGLMMQDRPEAEWLARRLAKHRAQESAHTLKATDGTVYLVRTRATPDGGRVIVFADITEKTRAEAALANTEQALADQQSKAEVQNTYLADLSQKLDRASAEAEGAKNTLLRAMSHELKTPLNAILGFSDLMQSMAGELKPEQVREYAGLIHQGGASLLRLLNQIMDLTKLAAGRYDLRRGPLDAGLALADAAAPFAVRAAERNIDLSLATCPKGVLMDADENVVGTMLAQLVDNALRFTQPGGAVQLSLAQEGAMIALLVADNGPGVYPADIARILRPFEQAGDLHQHAGGSGLGLTLVKAFAELHGGALHIHSAPGEGFCAKVTFPAAA
ncbi:MAG: PAS-domain containing protein [Alphaproteobacteria bacterium]|nr:PAS-domain containing protein [Alphaproteobacteria bacterium]